MRKLLPAVLLMMSLNVFAGGRYDGIYQVPFSGAYLTVNQNGNTLVIFGLALPGYSIGNTQFDIGAGAPYSPGVLNVFSFYIGQMNSDGVSARLTNDAASLGACKAISDFSFSDQGIVMTGVSLTNTVSGNAQGVNCPGKHQAQAQAGALSITFNRIF